LAGNALFGWWWLDPVAALVIAAVATTEGLETWRGDGCCAAPGMTPMTAACEDDCCGSHSHCAGGRRLLDRRGFQVSKGSKLGG